MIYYNSLPRDSYNAPFFLGGTNNQSHHLFTIWLIISCKTLLSELFRNPSANNSSTLFIKMAGLWVHLSLAVMVCALVGSAVLLYLRYCHFKSRPIKSNASHSCRTRERPSSQPQWHTIAPLTLNQEAGSKTKTKQFTNRTKRPNTFPSTEASDTRAKRFFKKKSSNADAVGAMEDTHHSKQPTYVHASWTIAFGGAPHGLAINDTTALLKSDEQKSNYDSEVDISTSDSSDRV
jgi:hypothetical protein